MLSNSALSQAIQPTDTSRVGKELWLAVVDIVDWKEAGETIQRVNPDTAGRTYPHLRTTIEATSIRQLKHPEIQNKGRGQRKREGAWG
jgi:hypothetical protein